jgi:type II secretory pathway predicted ATPase ExeA
MPKLYFNVAGPCVPGEHYMLDPLPGIGDELMNLIDSKQYFVIHAARQSGKTTLLWGLVDAINARGDYYALYCSLEAIQELKEPEIGIPGIVNKIADRIERQNLPEGFAKNANYIDFSGVLNMALTGYCQTLNKPLIIFFDEADCLSNGTLITFLRQLREGYVCRGREPFVHTVALVGMRNIRDYKAHIRPDSETLGSASPFNIMTKSINLRNFTQAEVAELYAQHTNETGQTFDPKAVDYVFEQTQGQPWLVNAIACECVEKITKKDYSISITQDLTKQAIQNLILQWGTHFDSLLERLKEPRVRNIITPLITGDDIPNKRMNSDYQFVKDLGLIRDDCGKTEPANPIYAELIIRTLNWDVQDAIKDMHKDYTLPRYIKDGKVDMDYLIKEFQAHWRENSEIWKDRYRVDFYNYDEAAPQLVMQAFLQRVVNGGGQVLREMAVGTRQADLCVVYEEQKYPIELKILQNEKSRADSKAQILAYMDKVGSNRGWLVLFDRNAKKSWGKKIYMKKETVNGKEITIAGC